MSRTKKEGKRGFRKPKAAGETPEIAAAIQARHTFGRTEKILRRNRKVWTRLVNKRRRMLDDEATRAGAADTE